jgi:hypothetical protein
MTDSYCLVGSATADTPTTGSLKGAGASAG